MARVQGARAALDRIAKSLNFPWRRVYHADPVFAATFDQNGGGDMKTGPKMSRPGSTRTSPESQLRSFVAKFDTRHRSLIRAVRRALRKRLPTATEMVYDNYNFFVIGYSPTVRPSDAVLSIAAGASGVGLCFIHGARLPDPKKVLLGSGNQTRFIRLESATVLERPEVKSLIAAALSRAKPMPESGRGPLVIRSISAKQRPRRRNVQ